MPPVRLVLDAPGAYSKLARENDPGRRIPSEKPPLGNLPWESLDPASPDETWQAKLDGAFLYYLLDPSGARAFSWRRSKRTGRPIEHTEKLQGLPGLKVPPELQGAVLRGEAWRPDLSASEVGGILNSRAIPYAGALRPALHGIEKAPRLGIDSPSTLSPESEQQILRQISQALPIFDLPDTATTPEEKLRLLSQIEAGQHPQTSEGIVVRRPGGPPAKAVLTPTQDLPVLGLTEGRGRFSGRAAGALLVGPTDHPTRVGTGLSDRLRQVLHENPQLASKLVARVATKGEFPSGLLRAPSFRGFHPEKSDPEAYATLLDLLENQGTQKTAVMRRSGNQYVLYTKDGRRVLGRHPSHESALRQERAIQVAKHAEDEFAPGIPSDRSVHPLPTVRNKPWELTIHRHQALRAGEHFDLRLADPTTGLAHSWALPKAELPDTPGKPRLAIQQPTHTIGYMSFEGKIPEGTYGAGQVDLEHHGPTRVTTGPGKVEFSMPTSGRFVLRQQDGSKWLLLKKQATVLDRPGEFTKSADQRALLALLAASPLIGGLRGMAEASEQGPVAGAIGGAAGGLAGGALGAGAGGIGMALLQLLAGRQLNPRALAGAATLAGLLGTLQGGSVGSQGAQRLTGANQEALLEAILGELQQMNPRRDYRPDLLR